MEHFASCSRCPLPLTYNPMSLNCPLSGKSRISRSICYNWRKSQLATLQRGGAITRQKKNWRPSKKTRNCALRSKVHQTTTLNSSRHSSRSMGMKNIPRLPAVVVSEYKSWSHPKKCILLVFLYASLLIFSCRKKDAIDVESSMDFQELVANIFESQPSKLTVYFSLDTAKEAAKVCILILLCFHLYYHLVIYILATRWW